MLAVRIRGSQRGLVGRQVPQPCLCAAKGFGDKKKDTAGKKDCKEVEVDLGKGISLRMVIPANVQAKHSYRNRRCCSSNNEEFIPINIFLIYYNFMRIKFTSYFYILS